jgi:putative peptidoglycan lipid II flippase
MALGTLASRGTGFLRTAVIAAAIGSGLLGDAYNVANTTPNILYDLLLGGVLTSVVVPLLVQAAGADSDGGTAYTQRLLTVVLIGLGGATALAMIAAPAIVALYARGFTADQAALATTFTRFFLPQIVCYGLGATIGAVLNTRDRFAAPMWAPVLNNLVVIAAGLSFAVLAGAHGGNSTRLSTTQVLVLGVGTTAGIVAQTVALLVALRATGFRWRLRFDLRHTGLGQAGRLAGWMLVYVAASQAGYLVVVNLATAAAHGQAVGTGYSPYTYAYTLFQLPHAIVAVSVITALLPRMSRHAVAGRLDRVRADLSTGTRMAAVALVPASVGLIVLGVPVAVVVFGRGATGVAGAEFIGSVLAAFAVGLLPFSAYQLQLRAFYALRDTRTPALIGIALNAVLIAVDALLYVVLPQPHRVVGLALGFGVAYWVGLGISTLVLHRRLGGVDGRRVLRTIIRLLVAAGAGAVPAAVVYVVIRSTLGLGPATSLLAVIGGCLLGGTAFGAAALRMRVAEVAAVRTALAGRRHR